MGRHRSGSAKWGPAALRGGGAHPRQQECPECCCEPIHFAVRRTPAPTGYARSGSVRSRVRWAVIALAFEHFAPARHLARYSLPGFEITRKNNEPSTLDLLSVNQLYRAAPC